MHTMNRLNIRYNSGKVYYLVNYCQHYNMTKLSDLDRARVIGQLEAGWKQKVVAQQFGASQGANAKLKRRFVETGRCKGSAQIP